MLRDIVEDSILSQPDMELVVRNDVEDLEMAVKRCRADVAIVGDPPYTGTAKPESLLLAYPNLRVIVITGDGRCAQFFEFRRHTILEMSPRSLIETIRLALNPDAG
jgi:hypothetical protein